MHISILRKCTAFYFNYEQITISISVRLHPYHLPGIIHTAGVSNIHLGELVNALTANGTAFME